MFSGILSPFLCGRPLPRRAKSTLIPSVIGAIIAFQLCVGEQAFGVETPGSAIQPQALGHSGIYALRRLDPNLTGSGVNISAICRSITYLDGKPQNDYRLNIEHNCFEEKRIAFHDWSSEPRGTSAHSTAVGAILIGEDANAFHPDTGKFHYQGAAPQAELDVYEFWYFMSKNVFFGNPEETDVVTMSIGNQFEDWWTRGIESLAEREGLIVIAGIGNGSNVYDPVLYPAASANVLGVGVVDSVNSENTRCNLANFSLPHPQHSSYGPTVDGRCKPDIVAPGNCLAADVNDTQLYKPTGSWSSFSAPIVAGTAALLVQKAKEEPNLAEAISAQAGNCVMKAILMSSAKKLPYWHKGLPAKDDDHEVPLDYTQGAGTLNAVGAYAILAAGQSKPGNVGQLGWDNNILDVNGGAVEQAYRIKLPRSAGKFITATVAWNKHYADAYPFEPMPQEDSNLRLELWAASAKDADNGYLLDYSDSDVDNVEHIHCATDPNYSDYKIMISFSNAHEPNESHGVERYALAWNTREAVDKEDILWYDLNADGIVNSIDLTILVNNFSKPLWSDEGYLLGDVNVDGAVDANDLQILAAHNLLTAEWYEQSEPAE